MWRHLLQVCGLFIATVASLSADMEESAWQARTMLGPEHWAQVLRIARVRGGVQALPVRYALVFEFEDRLWFYAADEGTQSLSTRRGRLERDKADLGPLLKEIDPGYVRHDLVLKAPVVVRAPGRPAPLPQGCFIECVAYLQSMLAAGRNPGDVRLLAYYGAPSVGRRGHTVLYFAEKGSRYYYDPEASPTLVPIPDYVPLEALAVARLAAPGVGYAKPERAVFLPLRVPAMTGPDWRGREVAAGGSGLRDASAPLLMK